MKFRHAAPLLLLPLLLAGCSHPHPVAYYPPPPPPASDFARQGFFDGQAAARRDIRLEHPPGVERHPKFRNPPVPPPAIEEYRHAFRNGYNQVLHTPPPPPQ